MNKPLLTVLVPIYNAWPYLPEAVDSLLNQEGPSFELLMINDGSSDASVDYLDKLTDSRIRIIHQKNAGITAALNRGIAEAHTDWIVRHDADDLAYPGKLQKLSEAIQKHPSAGLFYTEAEYIGENGSVGSFRTSRAEPHEITTIIRSGYLPSICHPTVCFRKEVVQALGGYRFQYHVEDADLWWRIGLEHDLIYIPELTVGYRILSEGISSRHLKRQAINLLYIQYLLLSELWGKTPLSYETVFPELSKMLKKNELAMRKWIRKANICFSQGKKLQGICHLGIGAACAPNLFISRCMSEWRPQKVSPARNGINPHQFREASDLLWNPEQAL